FLNFWYSPKSTLFNSKTSARTCFLRAVFCGSVVAEWLYETTATEMSPLIVAALRDAAAAGVESIRWIVRAPSVGCGREATLVPIVEGWRAAVRRCSVCGWTLEV